MRRWGSRAGWCWWCRTAASFGWSGCTGSPDTPGHPGCTACWSSSCPDDGRWPTRHSLNSDSALSHRGTVCFECWSIECGMRCTCESLWVDVHPLNSLFIFIYSQNKLHFFGTVSLGSRDVAVREERIEKRTHTSLHIHHICTVFTWYWHDIIVLHRNDSVQFW